MGVDIWAKQRPLDPILVSAYDDLVELCSARAVRSNKTDSLDFGICEPQFTVLVLAPHSHRIATDVVELRLEPLPVHPERGPVWRDDKTMRRRERKSVSHIAKPDGVQTCPTKRFNQLLVATRVRRTRHNGFNNIA